MTNILIGGALLLYSTLVDDGTVLGMLGLVFIWMGLADIWNGQQNGGD